MKTLLSSIKIQVNDKIYVKDPETSILGRKIIKESILLIDELGFDNFTFKKLGERIGSNESSLYRYFENKHKLLLYLSSWYWSWMEYKLILATANVTDPYEKLMRAITIVTEKIEDDDSTDHINESILNKIIIAEFTKTFLTKEVDEENREGFFLIYKRVIGRIVNIVKEVNPDYPYAESLVSTTIEGALHQHFLKDHFKSITNCNEQTRPCEFFMHLVSNIIKQ
ncbi:TetR/AcrR family transcriptional regulator [Flavobacterium salilacus subsp. salilacus]|uniref:TetR/AcrR family transcriptional regulator n=1 Tax=Flavobacterium TaxID=237 RepID=UPI0010754FEF|nr:MULTISPECIES: TetR/AcrR family transcriptional regulator [Flavobacterium]KAF2518148.1 TetR/AcrR family transcriptional regulator [Flavobacterium salilacus subsp. salilacus]MBE1615542.1 TetR/AcrR family transcriptional regulator [Flavobacterium sp. SaA2.13]NDI99345.1 TetR/AcrR family transcriptional regulator [Flavobacterium salilacus subsp. altitudinum]